MCAGPVATRPNTPATLKRSQPSGPVRFPQLWMLLVQLDVEGFEALLQQWMAAQPGVRGHGRNPGLRRQDPAGLHR